MNDMDNANKSPLSALKYIVSSTDESASELIKGIYDNPDWVSHVDDRLRYKEYVCPKDADETLDDWVDMYINKKSRRVSYAGKKLKNVFLNLPGADKRKVALALLTGGKEDTEWVCKRLKNHKEPFDKEWEISWHPCYSKSIEECWNKYHGENCGLLFIQFLDEEIVRSHIEELDTDDNYFYLCQRFVNKPWFKFDAERLRNHSHINAYLSVMSQTKEGITEDEARRLLYQWIAVVINNFGKRCNERVKQNIFYSNKTGMIRIINAWGFDTALFYILSMGLKNVVIDFLKWESFINEHYYYDEIDEIPEDEIVIANSNIDLRKLIFEYFPKDLKYLLYPNKEHYQTASSPGQPLVIPKKIKHWIWTHNPFNPLLLDTKTYPMYLPEQMKEDNSSVSESLDTALDKLRDNPLFMKMEEELKLTPVNSQSFIDKHMEEHDLPF